MGTGASRIGALDGLRGLAALVVVLGHLSQAGWHVVPGLDLRGTGKPAVYLFFVLSSFLLTRQLCARPARQLAHPGTWTDYLTGRVTRVLPLYLVVLGACWTSTRLWGIGLPVEMDTSELVETVLLVRGDDILWTVPTELKFYLVLPVLAVPLAWLRPSRRRVRVVFGATLVVALVTPSASRALDPWPFMGLFLSGAVLGWADAGDAFAGLGERGRRRLRATGSAAVAVAALLTPVVFSVVAWPVPDHRFHTSHAVWAVVWSCVLLAAVHGRGRLGRWLCAEPATWLGRRSFSLYLWHLAALRLVAESGLGSSPWQAGVVALVGALVLADLSYRSVERPVLAWSRDLRARRRAARELTGGAAAPVPG